MHQRRTLLSGEGLRVHDGIYFLASCQPIDRKRILNTSTQRILWMKTAFAARVNLVTQVVEIANFSCWLRKSEKPTKKLLACAASKAASQHLHVNKVIRESSCVYLFLFRIYFLFLWGSAWITTCIFLETTYLILATLQVVAGGKKCCFKR